MTKAASNTDLDLRVPRYTSYPTAPHFDSAVGAETFGRWLAALPQDATVSLYLHIPYCDTLCWFCACRTQGTRRHGQVTRYLAALEQEVARVAALVPAGCRVARLHLGGGSPTILTADEIGRLFGCLRAAFRLAGDAEIAVEIDPRDIDEARLDALAAAGLTRASIGVQDFEPRVQAAINRHQGRELTARVIDGLRARGVASLNIDALYGLPFQTVASVERTIGQVIALRPDRLALFGYAHVPWMARRQQLIPEDALPATAERLAQAEAARALLAAAGYVPVGIDHFALPGDGLALAAAAGRLHRNFQGYTDDRADALIGLGASAISRLPQGYAQNAATTADWFGAIDRGGLATARGHALGLEDRLRAAAIERLMCDFSFDAPALRDAFGDIADRVARIARRLLAEDRGATLERTAGGFRIRPEARARTRLVAAAFDAYLGADSARHSTAI